MWLAKLKTLKSFWKKSCIQLLAICSPSKTVWNVEQSWNKPTFFSGPIFTQYGREKVADWVYQIAIKMLSGKKPLKKVGGLSFSIFLSSRTVVPYLKNFFLIGIHSMQGWIATMRHGVTKKKKDKNFKANLLLRDTGNLFGKDIY